MGEAAPAPLMLTLALWLGVFSVVAWGLGLIFQRFVLSKSDVSAKPDGEG